jgi:hypothetical protein
LRIVPVRPVEGGVVDKKTLIKVAAGAAIGLIGLAASRGNRKQSMYDPKTWEKSAAPDLVEQWNAQLPPQGGRGYEEGLPKYIEEGVRKEGDLVGYSRSGQPVHVGDSVKWQGATAMVVRDEGNGRATIVIMMSPSVRYVGTRMGDSRTENVANLELS